MAKVEVGSVAAGSWQSSTASSAAVDVSHLNRVRVGLGGTFVGTLFVDVSFDGTTFVPWQSLTAPGVYNELPACKQFKIRTSAYTSGTPAVGYGGVDAKSASSW